MTGRFDFLPLTFEFNLAGEFCPRQRAPESVRTGLDTHFVT